MVAQWFISRGVRIPTLLFVVVPALFLFLLYNFNPYEPSDVSDKVQLSSQQVICIFLMMYI